MFDVRRSSASFSIKLAAFQASGNAYKKEKDRAPKSKQEIST
jgi:hypothetical protein